MSNESALKSLLTWWRSIPEYRRPGHDGHFYKTGLDVEAYVLALREQWASCGKAVLAICEPLREELEREARGTIQDLLAWLELVSAKLLAANAGAGPVSEELQCWLEKWRECLGGLTDAPLREAPGVTFGVGPGAHLLENYRWCGDVAGEPCGVGGPLSDVPASLGALLAAFPGSVTELQFSVSRSPWTAAYVLNWLLSNKGVLPPSRKSPPFDGPSAVPHARAWLDQLAPVFRDWHTSKFEGRQEEIRYKEGRLVRDFHTPSSPSFSAAVSQLGNPIVPSAYVVPFGSPPIPTSESQAPPLETGEGQCMVFEFLLSRLQILAPEATATPVVSAKPPLLVIVNGSRTGTFALQVNGVEQPNKLPKGAAILLNKLGKGLRCERVLAHQVTAIRTFARVAPFVEVGKKVKNRYVHCSAPELRGQVSWKASSPPGN